METKGMQNTINPNDSLLRETFFGYIETTNDALLIFEACKRGILPKIKRRLQDKEKISIQSGTVFCFDERESGIKRWTDGFIWSPSRVLGNFLIYRELQDNKKKDTTYEREGYIITPETIKRQKEKLIVGSLKHSIRFKPNGLIKKSISFIHQNVQQHIISYYTKDDVLSGKLTSPSTIKLLSTLDLSIGIKLKNTLKIQNNEEESGLFKVAQSSKRTTTKRKDSVTPNQNETPTTSQINKNFEIFNSNISLDKNFSNTNQSSIIQDSVTNDYILDHSSSNRYFYDESLQNPYQHLYSSASFHSINHASIIRNHNPIVANSFMEEMSSILGWSEFELQM